MVKFIRQTRVMEPKTIQKNGAKLNGHRSCGKFLLFGVFLLVFCSFANKAMGQSWSLNNGTLTISDNSALSNSPYPWANNVNEVTKLVIGSGVTSIPNGAFYGCSNLTDVNLEDGQIPLLLGNQTGDSYPGSDAIFLNCPIKNLYLGRNVNYLTGWGSSTTFQNNTTLTTLTIGNSVTSIGNSSFSGCTILQTVTIGSNVTAINDDCFNGCCGLTKVNFGSGLTSIGNHAFYNCTSLASTLDIPDKVKTIGYSAFYGCEKVSSVTIPNSVTSIGYEAFNNCLNLKTVTIADGTVALRFIGQYAQGHFQNSPIETLYLGRNLETEFIDGDYSDGYPFSENSALKSIAVGNNVTAINDNSFDGCTGLQLLTMSSTLISIGNNAFNNCSNLSSTLAIPQGVKTIGAGAFQNCSILPSVTVPNSVTSIGSGAFNNCLNLKTVTIADGTVALRFIGQNFAGHFQNSPIETLYLGRNLETEFIDGDYSDGYPFSENSALKSLTVGNNVTAINDYSFQNCTGLTQITSNATEPPALQTNTFNGVNRSINVIVPCGYLNDYRKNQDWNTFINMNDGGCTGIEDVSANQLSIYPNPVKDEIFIKSDLQIAKVEIYSSTGALLLSDNNFNEKISVSKLLKGVYLIKVYTSNGIIVSKIVKE